MKPHSTASCFATYLLPHVLFVADFEEREWIAKICCLAWNIHEEFPVQHLRGRTPDPAAAVVICTIQRL